MTWKFCFRGTDPITPTDQYEYDKSTDVALNSLKLFKYTSNL